MYLESILFEVKLSSIYYGDLYEVPWRFKIVNLDTQFFLV